MPRERAISRILPWIEPNAPMLNPFKEVDWSPDLPARRKFAISWIIGFPIVALLILLVGRVVGGTWKLELAAGIASVGTAAGVLLWLLPQIAKPFYVIWFAFGCSMGIVIGNLLFLAFFYLVITPFGLARRFNRNPAIAKGFRPGASSYWKPAKQTKDPKRYYRQY